MSHSSHLLVVAVPPVLGAAVLGFATISPDGSPSFFLGTFLAAAVWWLAWWLFGSVTPGGDAPGSEVVSHESAFQVGFRPNPAYRPGREALRGLVVGAGLLAVFVVGALVVLQIPVLSESVDKLMNNVRVGGLALTAATTAINAAGEELFFRQVLIHRLQILGMRGAWLAVAAVGIYALVTVAMGVFLLVFAAVALGALTFYEARRSGGVVAPIVAHLTWSLGMLLVLPLI